MLRRKTTLLGLVITLMLFCIGGVANARGFVDEPKIKIGLWSNQPNIMITAVDGFIVANAENRQQLRSFSAGERMIVTIQDGRLALNGTPLKEKDTSILIAANNKNGDNFVEVNKRCYRGVIEIHQTHGKAGLTAVNILPIEQYLYGVIAREISPDWSIEAVKAQAVAARTYALYNLDKHKEDGYDVCATTDCQVYGGVNSEAVGSVNAVNATRGQVLTYQGKLVAAYFHSSSGGYTENSENVWGSYQAYLRGVADDDSGTPYHQWEKQMSVTEFQDKIANAGYNVGVLRAIVLSPLKEPPVAEDDRGVSGRVKNLFLIGDRGNVQLTGNKLRTILGLNSTLFDISLVVPRQKAIEIKITDSAGDHQTKEMSLNLPPAQEKVFNLSNKQAFRRFTGHSNETIIIKGFGWGHGIGLSQWGAKKMAEQAPQGDATYFKKILKHYYQDVEIEKMY